MLAAIRDWFDRLRAPRRHELMTWRRVDDRHIGFVRLGREWFQFRSALLTFGDGQGLVTSFYRVVGGDEALAFREEKRLGTYPHPEEATRTWYWQEGPADVAELMLDRESLPNRAYWVEGNPEDPDGSLDAAIEEFRHELRHKSAQTLQEERMDPDSDLHVAPSEKKEDMFNYPGWDGTGHIRDYLAKYPEDEFPEEEDEESWDENLDDDYNVDEGLYDEAPDEEEDDVFDLDGPACWNCDGPYVGQPDRCFYCGVEAPHVNPHRSALN